MDVQSSVAPPLGMTGEGEVSCTVGFGTEGGGGKGTLTAGLVVVQLSALLSALSPVQTL